MTDPLTPDPIAEENARLRRQVAEQAADNAELRKKIAAQPAPNIVKRAEPPTFRRSDLKDARFFAEHRRDILDAASHGRIIDDMPDWRINRPARKAGAK